GVYPVRAAYPATIDLGAQFGDQPQIALSDRDGRGVSIALLDTGVDRAHPFLRGRVTNGIDIVGGDPAASAVPEPAAPSELEAHGTEMAGLLVGSGGPGGLAGVRPGATLLPIRVAGWQRDASARWAVYARTDQLLAGIERAVDPNDDGDAHDAARVALVGVAEPFGGFADGPLALAAAGAMRVGRVVVGRAATDGPVGPGYGSIAGPGGAPAALTVGALDLRQRYGEVRVVLRDGLQVEFDGTRPLASAVTPSDTLDIGIGAPRAQTTAPAAYGGAIPLLYFFDRKGISLVAGRAALVPAGPDPSGSVAKRAGAGAVAALFYGAALPAGGISLDETGPIPAVSISEDVAVRMLARLRHGIAGTLSLGAVRSTSNGGEGHVAQFSSSGLAYDGRVKPDLVAPGVALETAEPGTNPDGSARYGTVNGTSVAAALVAGGAALLAQARPYLDAEALKGLLVGSARPVGGDSMTAQGAGLVDVGGATATEFAASPTSLAFGRADGARWRAEQVVAVRNVSYRRVILAFGVDVSRDGAAPVQFEVSPLRVSLPAGRTVRVHIRARLAAEPQGTAPAEGSFVAAPAAGGAVHVPWTILFGARTQPGLTAVRLSVHAFHP